MIGIGMCHILWKNILKYLLSIIGVFLLSIRRDKCELIDLVIWRQLAVVSRSYCHSNEVRRTHGFTQAAQIELIHSILSFGMMKMCNTKVSLKACNFCTKSGIVVEKKSYGR